jgi:uracil-xanthine permease
MVFTIVCAVAFRGFISRIAVFLALVFGTALSWLLDKTTGEIHSVLGGATEATDHFRVNFDQVKEAAWIGFPDKTMIGADGQEVVGWHLPSFHVAAILLVLPAVIALIAENTGHVKAVAEMTGHDLDPYMGRAIAADGVGTAVASAVGGSPTTTYAENIGVMAVTRIYSTLVFVVAAVTAIVLGFSPKFGALIGTIPGPVLGGLAIVVFGLITATGCRIFVVNNVDFGRARNLVTVAATLTIGAGDLALKIAGFTLGGIGTATFGAVILYQILRDDPARP